MSAWASMAIRGANTIALLLGFACCSLARINMWSILINKPECLLPRNKVVNDHLLRECQIMRQWLNKAVPQPCISRASFPWKINKAAICCVLCCCKAFYLWLKKKKVIIQGKLCSAVGCLCFPPRSVCSLGSVLCNAASCSAAALWIALSIAEGSRLVRLHWPAWSSPLLRHPKAAAQLDERAQAGTGDISPERAPSTCCQRSCPG